MERKKERDGSAEIKEERRGEEGYGRVSPKLIASILRQAEPHFIKRAPKIKLKIDVASKHPAQACASLTSLPPSSSSPPPLSLALCSAALTSIGSYCMSRASWQRPIVFAPFIPSSSTPPPPLHPHPAPYSPSLQPQNRAWVGSMVIVIPKTNWPSFNSTDKCKKLGPQKPGCLRSVCGATIQHNHTSLNNTEEPILLQGGFLDRNMNVKASYLGSESFTYLSFP